MAVFSAGSLARAQTNYDTPYTFSTLIDYTAGVNPNGIAVDAGGTVYVSDANNAKICKFGADRILHTIGGAQGQPGSTDGAAGDSRFNNPEGITLDGSGDVIVADSGNSTIRKISAAGVVTTLAGTAGVVGYADGTGGSAQFNTPVGIVVDGAGNIFVADQGNDTIRKITPSGVVTTLAGIAGAKGSADGAGAAARFDRPAGMALDQGGNLYVADSTNELIRKITPSGVVSTLAGFAGAAGTADGTGAAARFYFPIGVAVDTQGSVFVVEQTGETVRKITPSGEVNTVAGTPGVYGGADGTGASALFDFPVGIAVDSGGALYVADNGAASVRKGTFGGPPQFQSEPGDRLVAAGASATFTVSVSGTPPFAYQWTFNGTPIAGADSPSFSVAEATESDAGSYAVVVTNGLGSATSHAALLSVSSGASARIVNISTRAMVGTGGNILIPGFVVSGSGMETLLIRGGGPALSQFSVSGFLQDPILSVLDSQGHPLAYNQRWGSNSDPAQVANAASSVGAFPFAAGSADCALIVSVPAGAYTVQITGVNGSTGIALAEVYEISSTGTRLANISTRAEVGTGANIVIPGFVVSGNGTERLLVRSDGPALAQFGVAGFLAQPSLGIFDATGTEIASNVAWGTDPGSAAIASAASSVGAFAFVAGSDDSAKLISLQEGAYTVQVAGVGGTSGVALAEIYELP